MLINLGHILAHVPYWVIDQLPLFLFIVAFLFIFKLRSKTAAIFFLTLSAAITFYLSYTITTACWTDLRCSMSSGQEVCLVNSYCNIREENWITAFWAFLKAFVLWFVALKILFFKSIYRKNKIAFSEQI